MKKLSLLVFVSAVTICSCNQQDHTISLGKFSGEKSSLQYKWNELTAEAAFPKSYNFQLFAIRDTIWAFHTDGNWYSLNGRHWIKSTLANSIHNLAFLDYVVFNGAVYGLGHFEGNIEKHQFTPEIYKTTDLKTWTLLSKKSNLPRRFFYHPFV